MNTMRVVLLLIAVLLSPSLWGQTCTTPGQTPSTAFPVCGTTVFQQTSVPLCVSNKLYVPGCSTGGAAYEDRNPFWYRFTCYASGTLGFVIKPNAPNEDYDWQLYDITGKDPDAVFTDNSTVVTGNWSGTYGNTGASANGVNFIQCGSDPTQNRPTFSAMPSLVAGRTYLLLVSHFTNTQSGYSLSFEGGTASINDPAIPRLKAAEANCGGDVIRLKLSKKIYCNSLTAAGAEFYLTNNAATVVSATGIGCSGNFDTDSVEIRLSSFLAPGNYTLRIRKAPADGNTLLDYCKNAVPEGDEIPFVLLPKYPTPMDSLVTPTCAPSQLKLVFSKPMACNSIAANGSDFRITGPYGVSVTAASGGCTGGLTKEITLTLSAPMQRSGSFQLWLQRGSDGNTLINECGEPTPAGESQSFSLKDTVNADFTYTIGYGCTRDTVYYAHHGRNEVESWKWTLDEGQGSTQRNPTGLYAFFTTKTATLVVSNGFCRDSSSRKVVLENFLKADFSVLPDNCPEEAVPFTDRSIGKGLSYRWNFGDGATSDSAAPHHAYRRTPAEATYTVRLTVTDSFGCSKTTERPLTVYSSCYLAVPSAFTPNNDGKNDRFRVLNAVKADGFELRVFNRWGQAVFTTRNWKEGWDGKVAGAEQASGVYVWTLRYTHRDTGKRVEQKGTTVLIR